MLLKQKPCILDLTLSSAKPLLNVFIKDTHVEIVPSFKYLSLHFDQYLSWNFHVDQITSLLQNKLVCFIELGSTYHRRVLKFCIIQFCFQELTIVMLYGATVANI